jgi:hypothetical protein
MVTGTGLGLSGRSNERGEMQTAAWQHAEVSLRSDVRLADKNAAAPSFQPGETYAEDEVDGYDEIMSSLAEQFICADERSWPGAADSVARGSGYRNGATAGRRGQGQQAQQRLPGMAPARQAGQGRQNCLLADPAWPRELPGRIILRRRVAVRLPSAARRSLASSQFPYSAWSVSILRTTSLDVLRGRLSMR